MSQVKQWRLRPVAARLGYDDLAICDQVLAGLSEKVEEQVIMVGGDLANAINIAQGYYIWRRFSQCNKHCLKILQLT